MDKRKSNRKTVLTMAEPKHIKQIYEEMKAESTKKIIRVFPRRTNATPDDYADKRHVGAKMREVTV
jgi:methylphosphotriester-DNA--protein-cysteine methyltransferase